MAMDEAKEKCDPPVLPRQRRQPNRYNEGAAEHTFQSVEDIYRQQFLNCLTK